MTFYNVISGLLFLGAVQQMALGVAAWEASHVVLGALLAVLVFNDAVYTSHVVEGEKTVAYELPLMLNDLFNFLLLAFAMAALNPTTNALQADLSGVFRTVPNAPVQWFAETWYWSLLGVYWLSIMLWTYRAGKYGVTIHRAQLSLARITDAQISKGRDIPYPKPLLIAAVAIALVFFVEALFVALRSDIGGWGRRAVALAYFIMYVAWIRPTWLDKWDQQQLAAIRKG